jgi:hypothetical protein
MQIKAMTLSGRARIIGKTIEDAVGASLEQELNAGIAEFVGWPFAISGGRVEDANGRTTAPFACVVHTVADGKPPSDVIAANNAAVVIDVIEDMGLDQFRAAYDRIAEAKRLQKSPAPKSSAVATLTLTMIFAKRATVSLEALAEDLQRLNDANHHEEWPDMIAVSSVGVISLACQFPGHPKLGDIFPPAERGLKNALPPWYVIITMRPTLEGTFNKMVAFIAGYAAIFSPGAKVPNFSLLLDGVCPNIVTLAGYQYNLAGELKPVPRQYYADRYLPPVPMRIEDKRGGLLSTVEYIPWQDGGVVLMQGKLPLEGILVFLGKEALSKGGVIKPAPGLQLSYVMPIKLANFTEMLARLSRQSNMFVRPTTPSFTIQKMANEGTSTPFVARMYMGIMRLRDAIYSDPKECLDFDKVLDQTYSALMAARTTAKEIREMWDEHRRKVLSGELARLRGSNIHVDEDLSAGLRREVESFVYSAARAFKEGMKNLGRKMGKEISFMFQKQTAYERGLLALQATDPGLADYLRETRTSWSQRLINTRNAIDHEGWSLPRIEYRPYNAQVEARQPLIDGQPTVEFVEFMLDRLGCFVEEFTAHCLQFRMPLGVTITEVPFAERLAESPERFRLTLRQGGLVEWKIRYHAATFDNI